MQEAGADSRTESTSPSRGPRHAFSPWRHRLGVTTAFATLGLIFVGGLVTSTGSGLAVPDWPLSYGMLMPPMVGGVFYEHGHRLAASLIGLLTLGLVVWTARTEARRGVRRLAWACLLAVVLQGLLGGLTVIYLLPLAVSVTHACLAQTFFCLVITLAYATSREWLSTTAPGESDVAGLRKAAPLLAGIVYLQLLVGALMRHMGAGLAIPDFPLAFGRLLPPLTDAAVAVHFAHRLGAILVLAAALYCVSRAWWMADRRFLRGSLGILALVVAQISLGGLTVLSGRLVFPATLHVATGAATLGASWLLTLRVYRALGRDGGVAVTASLGEPAAAA